MNLIKIFLILLISNYSIAFSNSFFNKRYNINDKYKGLDERHGMDEIVDIYNIKVMNEKKVLLDNLNKNISLNEKINLINDAKKYSLLESDYLHIYILAGGLMDDFNFEQF